jgi:hypothetical protein
MALSCAENAIELFVDKFDIDKVLIPTCRTGKFKEGDLYSERECVRY